MSWTCYLAREVWCSCLLASWFCSTYHKQISNVRPLQMQQFLLSLLPIISANLLIYISNLPIVQPSLYISEKIHRYSKDHNLILSSFQDKQWEYQNHGTRACCLPRWRRPVSANFSAAARRALSEVSTQSCIRMHKPHGWLEIKTV